MATFASHLPVGGLHSARASASSVPAGTLYYETDTKKIFQSDGTSTWTVWADLSALGGARLIQVKVIDDATVLTTGEGKAIFMIPTELNGLNLSAVAAFVTTVSSSGLPSVGIRNITQSSVEMLTTNITIDASEFTSYTAATAAVIDAAHKLASTGDLIAIDVDVAGTGAKGLGVVLTFS